MTYKSNDTRRIIVFIESPKYDVTFKITIEFNMVIIKF